MRALKDNNDEVREALLFGLGQLGPVAKIAAPDVAKLLKDKAVGVRKMACQALGDFKAIDEELIGALIAAMKDQEIGPNATAALGRIGPGAAKAVPALAAALEKPALREYAALALGKIGPKALPALVEALKNKNADVRIDATLGLGLLGKEARPLKTAR